MESPLLCQQPNWTARAPSADSLTYLPVEDSVRAWGRTEITGEGTLGAGLIKLETAGLKIHPALKGAWSKMYGWTSDEGGIRHAGIDGAEIDQALAKYALVTCSAFVSYLIEEGRKVGLLA